MYIHIELFLGTFCHSASFNHFSLVIFICIRVKDYISCGLHISKLQDPDGGLNVAKTKAKLGVLGEIMSATLPSSFRSDGFSGNLSVLPQINYGVTFGDN